MARRLQSRTCNTSSHSMCFRQGGLQENSSQELHLGEKHSSIIGYNAGRAGLWGKGVHTGAGCMAGGLAMACSVFLQRASAVLFFAVPAGLVLECYDEPLADLMARLVVAPQATRYLFWKKVHSVAQLRQRWAPPGAHCPVHLPCYSTTAALSAWLTHRTHRAPIPQP